MKIKVRKIRQYFVDTNISDLNSYIKNAFQQSDLKDRINGGDRIGITVGSRGITNIRTIVQEVVSNLKEAGALPFILPAMGSHGGATAEGQKEVLASYGITEENIGVPVISSMETVKLGEVGEGLPVYFSKDALEADGIIALNRVKMHTDFTSDRMESGMSKVLVIGLGKHKGASSIHSRGVYGLKELIPEAAELIIEKAPVIQGIGIVENGYDQTMKISFNSPEKIMKMDQVLLNESKRAMPSLPINNIDIAISQELGKDISGTGLDTNVIGRLYINGGQEYENPNITKLIVLDLTDASHGNALGIGLADITTRKLVDKIDYADMYANCQTSSFLRRAKVPMTMETEKEAVELAVKTSWISSSDQVKLIIMKNTLELEHLYVSESVWAEIKDREDIEAVSDWEILSYDEEGSLEQKLE